MSDRPLLRDLIHIPERVQTNDFVLKLAEGVTEEGAAATIASYVVTKELEKAFDHALGIIKGALAGRKSSACYLHGSVEAETYCRVSGDREADLLSVSSSAWRQRHDRGAQPPSRDGGFRGPPAGRHSRLGALLDDERGGGRASDLLSSMPALDMLAGSPGRA